MGQVRESAFHARLNKDSIRHLFDSAFKIRMSKQVKNLSIAGVISVFWLIWKVRNQIIFDDASFSLQQVILLLWHCIQEVDNLDSETMENIVTDLMILKTFNGGIFKTYRGFCKGCFAKPLGILYGYEAELTRVITAVHYAQKYDWDCLWFECDSMYVVNLLKTRSLHVPWRSF